MVRKLVESCSKASKSSAKSRYFFTDSALPIEKTSLFPTFLAIKCCLSALHSQLNTHFLSTICALSPLKTAAERAQYTIFVAQSATRMRHFCCLRRGKSLSCDFAAAETSKKYRLQHPRRSGAKQRSGPAGAADCFQHPRFGNSDDRKMRHFCRN